MNAKRVSVSKLSKKSMRAQVKKAFGGNVSKNKEVDMVAKLQKLNEHFMNR